jgi:RHS repeat-associated protein
MRLLLSLILLFSLFNASQAEAAASATCPFYAINSSNGYKCFKTRSEAEDYIRTPAADGTRQNRKYLELTRTEPQQVVGGDEIYNYYGVKPRPGVEGNQGFKSFLLPNGNSAYVMCGCKVTGEQAWCVPYGSQSNTTNTPALATYGHYCNSLGTLTDGMVAYHAAQTCRQEVDVTVKTPWPSTPTSSNNNATPDEKPYPPNTGMFWYQGGMLRIQGADCNGNTVAGDRYLYVTSPVTCPVGWALNLQSLKTSEACSSNEWGEVIEYKPAVCPTGKCPKGGRYGNPVIAANGIKIQSPTGWNAESMLGLTLAYDSGNTDATANHFGGNWASLLSMRISGVSYTPYAWAFMDAEGLIDTFWSTTGGVYRSINSSGAYMTRTATECTVFEPSGRRLIFACVNGQTNRKLLRIEFPNNPIKNLTVLWSSTESFVDGVQTEFNNVPNALVRADGRRIDILYSRVNNAANCDAWIRPYACGAIRVKAIHDANGNITLFDYNADGRLAKIYYPDDTREGFDYGNLANICPSTMPACSPSTWPASMPATLLTGTYTETPDGAGGYVRADYGIYQYDSVGRAIVTTHPLDAGRTEFRYATTSDATPTVRLYTDATHYRDRKITSTRVALYDKPKTITEYNPSGAVIRSSTNTYNSVGYLATSTDFRGVRTDWTYNATTGMLTQKVEGANDTTGARRTTQFDWDASANYVTERRLYDSGSALPGTLVSRRTYAFNSRGQVTAQCDIDPANATAMAYACGSAANAPAGVKQLKATYCEQADVTAGTCPAIGQITALDGPRTDVSDVTTYTYFATDDPACASTPESCPHRRGDLWKVTNPLGHAIERLRYDGAGRALSIRNANGVLTEIELSTRGHVVASKTRGSDDTTEADDGITRYEVDANGQVTKVTRPDGSFIDFKYDGARRLQEIKDALGNSIAYSRAMDGTPVQEDTKDAGGALKKTLSRLLNHLGQLQTSFDGNGLPATMTMDVGGFPDTMTDALGRTSDSDFDSLNRLRKLIENTAGAASDKATTQFAYDASNHLVSVIDPKGLSTSYGYNGLGQLTSLGSPDTGLKTYGYDSAELPASVVDARGVATLYTYDALGRVTLSDVPTAGQDVSYVYDVPQADCSASEVFGTGRAARMTDESGSTRYCYDRHGNLVRKVQTVTQGTTLTTGATYDNAGNVVAMTYPSGAIVTYTRNANGQVTRVDAKPTASAAQVTLVSNILYMPFGPVRAIAYGNGRTHWRSYDQNYGIDALNDGVPADGLYMDYALDAVGNVTAVNERTSMYRTYEYDGLDRLKAEMSGATNIESFTYDATGNRQSKTVGASTQTYTYDANSHRLTNVSGQATRTYDASGNTVAIGSYSLPHDDRNRLREFHVGATHHQTYIYNGKGERVLRIGVSNPAVTLQFVYDEAGHLIGEYNSTGGRVAEYVWVADLLVGVLKAHQTSTYQYVETDALGTPRAVINPVTNTTIWRWDLTPTAFGDHAADTDPDANGVGYNFNLRYPGQYYNGLDFISYNYYRDYDARTGRYIQSDPIGLDGGISTFGYVSGNPLSLADPSGLTAYLNFTPNQEILMRRATDDAIKAMKECAECECGSDGGYCLNPDEKQKLLEMLQYDANWDYQGRKSDRGYAQDPTTGKWYPSKFGEIVDGGVAIYPVAFFDYPCPLASLLIHEATHAVTGTGSEHLPYAVEEKCTGCSPRMKK